MNSVAGVVEGFGFFPLRCQKQDGVNPKKHKCPVPADKCPEQGVWDISEIAVYAEGAAAGDLPVGVTGEPAYSALSKAGLFMPKETLVATTDSGVTTYQLADAHFHGTFTMKRNTALVTAKKPLIGGDDDAKFADLKARVNAKVPAAQR